MRKEVDATRPVENPELVRAIAQLAEDGSEETQKALWGQLHHAVFLVPTLPDEIELAPDEEEGRATLLEGSILQFLAGEQDGQSYLLVFTDWQALREFTDREVGAVVMTAEEAWQFALEHDIYDGVVINAGGTALPLERHQLEAMVHQSVENPDLVLALDRWAAEASVETRQAVRAELDRATLLVAAFSADSEDEDAIQLMVAEVDGVQYLPLFTDEDAVAEATEAEVLLQAFPARQAWEFVLEKADYCEAVVINPASHGFVITKEQLQLFLASPE